MTGAHWHRCRLALRPGHLLVAAEQYVADSHNPEGHSVATLPVHLPDDPDRRAELDAIVEASWRPRQLSPTDIVATHDVVTVTCGAQVLTLRSDGLVAWGLARRFHGRLGWFAPSPFEEEGVVLVRIDLARAKRTPRHRSLVLTLDTGTRAVEVPDPGSVVIGSHYASGHAALKAAGGSDAAWLGGRLLAPPEVLPLRRGPGTDGRNPERRR